MTISLSGVISPPGTRGTTEYSPPRCMLARKRSLVSCSVWCSGSRMSSFHRLARIDVDRRLADLAAVPAAVAGEHLVERLELLGLDDREQLGARVRKVLAQMIDDRLAGRLQLGFEQVGDQRHAAAAAGAGLGAALERVERVELAVANRRADRALADVVARADLGRVGHRVDADRRAARAAGADDQLVRLAGQRRVALGEHRAAVP